MAKQEKVIDTLIEYLDAAARGLEEFQVQLALGKAEARDKFEEVKKSLNKSLQTAKRKAAEYKKQAEPFQARLEHLRVQLALGKAETRDALLEQKKRILKAIRELEAFLRESGLGESKEMAALRAELEQVKIKLGFIEQKVQGNLGGKKKKELDEIGRELKEKLAGLKKKMMSRKPDLAAHWGHFTKEMDSAFRHMKKAFQPKA